MQNHAEQIKQEVTDLLASFIPKMVLDPEFKFRIRQSSITKDYSLRFDRWYNLIKIEIETNNRPLFMGQFMNIPVDSLRGLFSFYYSGLVDGFLRAKYGDMVANSYVLALDVYEMQGKQMARTTRYMRLEDAINEGIIMPNSLLYRKMKEYGLGFILLTGASISGPSLDMIDFVTEVLQRHRIHSVLDLFSGTGSLAKICLQKGSEYVLAVDIHPEVIESNLGHLSAHAEIRQANAYEFVPDRKYDLAIIDPFYDDALIAATTIIPKLVDSVSLLLLNIGRNYETFWISKASNAVKELLRRVELLKGYYSTALLGYSDKI